MSQLVTWSIFQPLTLVIGQPCLFIVKFKTGTIWHSGQFDLSLPELILSWSKDLYKSDFRDRELRWQLHWHEEQWPGREWGVIWPRLRNDRTQVASVLVPLQAAPWPPTITHPHILYISFIQCLPHTQHGLGHWCWLKNMECIPLSGTSWLAGYVKLMPWQFRSRSDHRH